MTKPLRVYISGAITGVTDFVAQFEAMEVKLREAGLIPVNPVTTNRGVEEKLGVGLYQAPYEEYLRNDIRVLVECDGIVVLPGWEASKGARAEVHVGLVLGLQFYDRDTMAPCPPPELFMDAFDGKESIALHADKLVNGPRRKAYGPPTKNFTHTAAMWTAFLGLGKAITAQQAAMMMVLHKISREEMNRKKDNLRDAIGYLLCIDSMNDVPAQLRDDAAEVMEFEGWTLAELKAELLAQRGDK